jgi:hypothetical protein
MSDSHDVRLTQGHVLRHAPARSPVDAKIDWKTLSVRLGHADVAFTMKQYVQADLEADRLVAHALAELIVGGSLASVVVDQEGSDDDAPGQARSPSARLQIRLQTTCRRPLPFPEGASDLVAGAGFEPATSGL